MELQTALKSDESKDFERVHLEEGVYTAEISEVKDISEGQYGQRVAFIYNVLPENKQLAYVAYKGVATQDNKLGKALIAHGVNLEEGKVNTENLPTKKVKIFVEDFKVQKDGKETSEVGSIISKVKPLVEENPN